MPMTLRDALLDAGDERNYKSLQVVDTLDGLSNLFKIDLEDSKEITLKESKELAAFFKSFRRKIKQEERQKKKSKIEEVQMFVAKRMAEILEPGSSHWIGKHVTVQWKEQRRLSLEKLPIRKETGKFLRVGMTRGYVFCVIRKDRDEEVLCPFPSEAKTINLYSFSIEEAQEDAKIPWISPLT